MNRLHKVSQAFSKAAETYDENSHIQSFAAQQLARRILQDKSKLGSVLEIGCGTGNTSSYLVPRAETYVISDVSSSVLQTAIKRNGAENVLPVIVDGENPCFTASFDIIVLNLVIHWFHNPSESLKKLIACLKPGGKLYFSTLGNNSFYEWRTLHIIENIPCGLLDFPTFGQVKEWFPLSGVRTVEEEWLSQIYASSLNFLKTLKGAGSYVPHPAYRALPFKTFKKTMLSFDQNPKLSYQILYGFYQKPETVREE